MIRPLAVAPTLAALLASISVPARAQTGGNAEPLAAAQAFDDGQLHGDRAALERLLATDFLVVFGSGRVADRHAFIDGFTGPNSKLDPFEITDRLFLRVSPDVAIAGGEARITGTEDGKRIAEHFRYADTFVRRDGRWMAVYTQVTPLAP